MFNLSLSSHVNIIESEGLSSAVPIQEGETGLSRPMKDMNLDEHN